MTHCASSGNTRFVRSLAFPQQPLVIAHRGGSLEAPENTIASIQHGVQVGADLQEIDVALSADGVPFVFHDDTLDRVTSHKGPIEELPWSQLQTIRIELPLISQTYPPQYIPSLVQILRVPEACLMIELKKTLRVQQMAQAVVQVLQQEQALHRVIIASFETSLLQAVHDLEPSLPLMGIIDTFDALPNMLALPIQIIGVHTPLVQQVLAELPQGVSLWTWTVYTPEQAQSLAGLGAHGLITDAPQAVLQVLRPQ